MADSRRPDPVRRFHVVSRVGARIFTQLVDAIDVTDALRESPGEVLLLIDLSWPYKTWRYNYEPGPS